MKLKINGKNYEIGAYTNLQGADLQGANLQRVNLQGANPRWANLRWANLRWADLQRADLRWANLQRADLQGANLQRANLQDADLQRANLQDADLQRANLQRADLQRANLQGANLREANLQGANLREADLRWADLQGADLQDALLPYYKVCPLSGSFIGWKKGRHGAIIKLKIPAWARRTSCLVSRKCRAEFAIVLSIEDNKGEPLQKCICWKDDYNFIYEVGKVVEPDSYNPDIREECTNGVHFFITKEEAVDF